MIDYIYIFVILYTKNSTYFKDIFDIAHLKNSHNESSLGASSNYRVGTQNRVFEFGGYYCVFIVVKFIQIYSSSKFDRRLRLAHVA